MRRIICAITLFGLFAAPAAAQPPASCEVERAQLRWLVQKYGQERTALEFALAQAEAARQALQAELDRLRVESQGR